MGAPSQSNSTPRIFVSHSHEDDQYCHAFVAELRALLGRADAVWYDEHNLGSGELLTEIQRQLHARPVFIVVLSKAALHRSHWVADECRWAFQLRPHAPARVILPVIGAPIEAGDFYPDWMYLEGFRRIEAPGMQPFPPAEAARRTYTSLTGMQPVPAAPPAPSGALVGHSQSDAPDGRPVKDKIDDGFPPVADLDRVSLDARGWAVVGSSRIGLGHLYGGQYRQDAIFAGFVDDSWHLAAVADGGGSYKLARLGAQMAARTTIEAMQLALKDFANEPGDIVEKARRVAVQGLRAAYRALYAEADRLQHEQDEKQSWVRVTVKDLRTALLLVLHRQLPDGSHLMACGQVGDGAVVVRAQEGNTLKLTWLSAPDSGPHGNETMFLPDVPDTDAEWQQRARAMLITSKVVYCLAMTDGITDDFTPLDVNLWRLEKPMFHEALSERDLHKAAQNLEDLLGYARQGSFDDRSLVCIYEQGMRPWE